MAVQQMIWELLSAPLNALYALYAELIQTKKQGLMCSVGNRIFGCRQDGWRRESRKDETKGIFGIYRRNYIIRNVGNFHSF